MKKLSKGLVAIIKPKVTDYNHRGTERTEDDTEIIKFFDDRDSSKLHWHEYGASKLQKYESIAPIDRFI